MAQRRLAGQPSQQWNAKPQRRRGRKGRRLALFYLSVVSFLAFFAAFAPVRFSVSGPVFTSRVGLPKARPIFHLLLQCPPTGKAETINRA
jgi:hypothetical protein